MKHLRRFSATMALAGIIATGMMLGTTRLEAKGKDGGSTLDATCAYLYSVITYPYASSAIQASAISLYISLGCTPAL